MKLTALHLSEEMLDELKKLSKEIRLSKSEIIREAIKEYLNEYTDYLIGLRRLLDKEDQIISSEEMRRRLNV